MSRYGYGGGPSRGAVAGVVAAVLVILSGIIWAAVDYNTQHSATVTVCSKERVAVEGGGEYRVYAAEGSYVMKDSLIGTVRYSTADAYAKIEPETTYDIVYKGWRIPFFSAFPNILKANKVSADRQTPQLCK